MNFQNVDLFSFLFLEQKTLFSIQEIISGVLQEIISGGYYGVKSLPHIAPLEKINVFYSLFIVNKSKVGFSQFPPNFFFILKLNFQKPCRTFFFHHKTKTQFNVHLVQSCSTQSKESELAWKLNFDMLIVKARVTSQSHYMIRVLL